ncbi:MAG: FAD-dependent oxidoreductase [Chitinophagales bacterium]|nr:FAD-dependent oxidoreductase [Chitinophagales bacterium]
MQSLNERKNNDEITSGEHISFWIDSTESIVFETLKQDISTDVLVIGGGIAGLTTAYCLLQSGKKVTLIEDGFIGSGESGRTTAHLANALDDRYYEIEKLFGKEKSRLAAESHTAAIQWIENTVIKEHIDCNFKRVNGYLFLHPSDKFESLEKELEATHNAGINTQLLDHIPNLPSVGGKCILFPQQGQFHILHYLKGLAESIVRQRGKIYTQTHATEISEKGCRANGYKIAANQIVVATNTPVNDLVTIHTRQFPYRTYVIAGKVLKTQLTPALWWDTGDQNSTWNSQPYHYVRLEDFDDEYYLLLSGGEDHKTGQADKENIAEEDRHKILERWTREKFPMLEEILYRWSGQVMEPLDSMAFIGRNPGDQNVFIITGDSGNGMTHGTLGGIIISDLINNKENTWAHLYKPNRTTLKIAGEYIKEAASMAAQYIDWVKKGGINSIQELKKDEGAVINLHMKKVAVYRDENEELYAYSAVCPHLGCILQWNADERSFDCPCHGSRFTKYGRVINGPATSDLTPLDFQEE